ncbi:MAG: 23S rRNA (pseudouridine(1915)-N(3))-methyltransferase RlmH [Firmicutes bacterium]|uniref:Ribosomal RNA large subunit methyltransferase H n=1 Tax=Sulfobacillus benefaciens TaxID=453960 RepID=A0A2T2WWL5_9FIRM|nr:23S rRNA (pseudouridine(1915)-N(3))-methyltransferase RlmH [Bacillota bacterium]PSR26625.1 MAG: 50S rRNA methyltransferase [Sulfobacillus benefaciens]
MAGCAVIVQAGKSLVLDKKIGTLETVTGSMALLDSTRKGRITKMARRWRFLTVGRPKDPALVRMIDEYRLRLEPWQPLDWEVTAEIGYKPGQTNEVLEREARAIIRRIEPPNLVILLDIGGQQVTSEDLSRRISRYQEQGSSVVFLVGGSLGVSERIRDRADWRWSLSPLTLPHSLAQLVAVEQIYRACSIIHHHPYHKA